MPRHIRTGDTVIVTAGDARGQTGVVRQILIKKNRVVVEGVNLHKKHVKPTQQNPQGGVIEIETSIHLSNVSPLVEGKPTRVRFPAKSDGAKVRVAVRNGKELHTLRKGRSRTRKGGAK